MPMIRYLIPPGAIDSLSFRERCGQGAIDVGDQGFWLWEVKSIDEAVEWVKKCPNPMLTDSDVEIRPLYSLEDLTRWKTSPNGR